MFPRWAFIGKRFFIAGLALLLGVQVSLALTLSELRTAIRRNVRDTASSTTLRRYSDTVLNTYVNEAQRIVINNTWASSDSLSQSVTAGTTYYSIPSDTIQVWRVTYNNSNLPELDLTQLDADSSNASWSTPGTPESYFRDRSNRNQIGLQPYPSSSGATLTIESFQLVPDLSADSDVPFDSDLRLYSYHDLLVYHVTYRIMAQEGRLTEAEIYGNLYDDGLQLMNLNVGHKPQRQFAPAKEVKP